MLAAAFAPEPVIVRMSDFKSNEYANLVGGELYEPHEEKPMIGYRGASLKHSASGLITRSQPSALPAGHRCRDLICKYRPDNTEESICSRGRSIGRPSTIGISRP